MPEDTQGLRKQLSDDDLIRVLDEAPAGIYDTPPLPTRSFD